MTEKEKMNVAYFKDITGGIGAWFDGELARADSQYRVHHLLETFIQELTRIKADVEMDIEELEMEDD